MSQPLSVVLPAYNEQENVGVLVARALEVLPSIVEDFEIIVVDDGSEDDTAAVVGAMLVRHSPRLRLVRHSDNQGYGAAIRTGFRFARGDLLFYTDSDNQFDISELRGFLPLIDSCDVAVGFRLSRCDTMRRSIASWVYNRLANVLFRVRVRDVNCAFKLFRREVIEQIDLESTDFFIDTEMLARARRRRFRIVQKGVNHYPRMAGETTVRPSDVSRTLLTIARLWRHIHFPRREPRPRETRLDDSAVEVELQPAP